MQREHDDLSEQLTRGEAYLAVVSAARSLCRAPEATWAERYARLAVAVATLESLVDAPTAEPPECTPPGTPDDVNITQSASGVK